MSEIAIRTEGLSKSYRIARSDSTYRYRTLREDLVSLPGRALKALRGRRSGSEIFWALNDISFDVREGEVLGIIGRNGAGKSTLLKILTGITAPTKGRAELFGRMGSLLEVGTGFHPELTGRENVFLSGAILGMTTREIKEKYDDIVAFSGIEKFMDVPAKRFSSGMYVRLAFAVAAHLNPEILLVDEVLAVGDAEFQRKCLGKMDNVARSGRTILFVSHNMTAVQQLCHRGIYLKEGQISYIGDIHDAVLHYLRDVRAYQGVDLAERKDREGQEWFKFTRVASYDTSGNELKHVLSGQDVLVRLYYESGKMMQDANVLVSFNVKSSQGYLLTNLNSMDVGRDKLDIFSSGYFECRWPKLNLRSGKYECNLYCRINGVIVDWIQSAFVLQVEDGDFYSTGRLIGREQGDVLVSHDWTSHTLD